MSEAEGANGVAILKKDKGREEEAKSLLYQGRISQLVMFFLFGLEGDQQALPSLSGCATTRWTLCLWTGARIATKSRDLPLQSANATTARYY